MIFAVLGARLLIFRSLADFDFIPDGLVLRADDDAGAVGGCFDRHLFEAFAIGVEGETTGAGGGGRQFDFRGDALGQDRGAARATESVSASLLAFLPRQ